jgi:hypothetical protein
VPTQRSRESRGRGPPFPLLPRTHTRSHTKHERPDNNYYLKEEDHHPAIRATRNAGLQSERALLIIFRKFAPHQRPMGTLEFGLNGGRVLLRRRSEGVASRLSGQDFRPRINEG